MCWAACAPWICLHLQARCMCPANVHATKIMRRMPACCVCVSLVGELIQLCLMMPTSAGAMIYAPHERLCACSCSMLARHSYVHGICCTVLQCCATSSLLLCLTAASKVLVCCDQKHTLLQLCLSSSALCFCNATSEIMSYCVYNTWQGLMDMQASKLSVFE